MQRVTRIKILVLILFVVGGAGTFLTDNLINRKSYARSSGPDPGFTGAPGEFNCRECHLEDGAPSGSITINAPQSYVPGQTYQITVSQSNTHPTRQRWGFQLTALDDTGNRAGTLQPGGDGFTQVLNGTIGSPARQYVEHTTAGTFQGQSNGASWTFNWTAPSESVGPVILYTAGNQANNDGNTSGDSINFTFFAIQPSAQQPDFLLTVAPSSQVILPNTSGTYTVTVTPTNGFTGPVNLSVAGLPANSFASFNPPTVQITDTSAKTSTLTIINGSTTPLGGFTLTVSGTSGALAHSATTALVTGPTMTKPDLAVRQVVAGLEQPTGMVFLGATDFLVIEKASGKVKRVVKDAVQGTVLDLAVNSASERGLLGIALHPNFSSNKFVYLYWTESATGVDTTDLALTPLLGNRVDRYVWDGTTLTHNQNLINLRAYQEDEGQPLRGNHDGGRLAFGPDGKLYILIGDVGRRGFLQNVTTGVGPAGKDDQFGGPEPDDGHLTGVVLRLNDDGTTPTDNPFFNAVTNLTGTAAVNVKKVFAYGIRNGFGMAFDPLSGKLWTQEHGDDAFDEINRIEAGFNGGWIQVMGPVSRIADYKTIEVNRPGGLQQIRWPPSLIADTAAEAQQRLYALPGSVYTDPKFSWKFAVAPSPIGFASATALGPQYANDMFVGASRTTLLGGYLFRFDLTTDRLNLTSTDARLADGVADNIDKFDLTESESLLVGRDFGITTDIQTGPDGALYILSLSNGVVYRVSAQPVLFVARLNGSQVVPPTNSPAQGTATLLLSADETTARVSLVFTGLNGGAQTGAHIHGPALASENAPELFALPSGQFNDFQINLSPQQVQHLREGKLYIDIHTAGFAGGEIRGQFGATLAAGPSVFEFTGAATTNVAENAGALTIDVTRLGDASGAATVDVSAASGTASDRSDFNPTIGTLRFASGERTKSITVFITDDTLVESSENFTLTLSNPTGAAALGSVTTKTVTILDNDTTPPTANPIDNAQFFVRQHYVDFLNREPDAAGLAFWTGQITECDTRPPAEQQGCREVRRINVSAAFFLSIEFQETGYLAYRFYEASFDRQPRYLEFLADTQEVSRGVIVNQTGWEQLLEANKVAYAERWVQRADFLIDFPTGMPAADYVSKLFQRAGVSPTSIETQTAVGLYGSGDVQGRARALRSVAESNTVTLALKSPAFVLMQYFGYLRRNPNDPPDSDLSGYNFWLGKLNSFGGDPIKAEMVKGFIISGEYRQRFGP